MNGLTNLPDKSGLQEVLAFCDVMRKSKHYHSKDPAEIFATLCAAKSLGLDFFAALNGSLFSVHGKIEMSAMTMNQLIRMGGHSVRVKELSDQVCTLTGKRADNGDIMEASFSYHEAVTAGIGKGGMWSKYRQDMLFARALSRLARRLFPDVIKGCYVAGETPLEEAEQRKAESETLGEFELNELRVILANCKSLDEEKILQFLQLENLEQIKKKDYDKVLKGIQDYEKKNESTAERPDVSSSEQSDDRSGED